MNCEVCNSPYNLTNRLPLTLPCCDESFCQECCLKIGDAPQDGFQCPIKSCGKTMESVGYSYKVTKAIEKMLKQSLGIYCDQHIGTYADFYCIDHQILICANCAVTTHKTHSSFQIEKQTLIIQNEKILSKLKVQHETTGKLIEEIEKYQKNEAQFMAKEYMNIMASSRNYLYMVLKSPEERNDLKFLRDQINRNIESLLITNDDIDFIQDSLQHINTKLELLYRGSRDGFGSEVFHEKCDNKGPTLVVAKSEHGKVFGGFASKPWVATYQFEFKADEKAFLFSITHKKKLVQYKNHDKALYHYYDSGPMFGMGCDLKIADKCNENNNSYSHLGQTYTVPKGIIEGTEKAKSYLAGAFKFKIVEIEVFKVIF